VFIIFSFSGNGLLAGLSMKRPSVYIDQWTEENAQWHLLENIKEQIVDLGRSEHRFILECKRDDHF